MDIQTNALLDHLQVQGVSTWSQTNTTGFSLAPYGHWLIRDTTLSAVPEPTTFLLLGIGIAGLAGADVRRRRKKKAVDQS